jgi:7,8-dihydropterin-6-yl-methyl-4-(beta-D-ribofuranosyl)aminobenzene 5'-phosphate synthase
MAGFMTVPATGTELATNSQIAIATVVDNYAVDARLSRRWGFAAVITTPSASVLFDTGGSGPDLLSNMTKLGLEARDIRIIVISHVHKDHLGGLAGFLRSNPHALVLIPKSFPDHVRRLIASAGARYQNISTPVDVAEGISTTGPMGISPQEQALLVETAEGLVVITGCAHPGIVSVVETARALRPEVDIALVMGGFHLLSASAERIDAIVRDFRRLGVKRVAPSHCTGDLARDRFRAAYGSDYVDGGAGLVLRFSAP